MQELPLWQSLRNVLKPQSLSYDREPGCLSASISLLCLLVFLSQTVSEHDRSQEVPGSWVKQQPHGAEIRSSCFLQKLLLGYGWVPCLDHQLT